MSHGLSFWVCASKGLKWRPCIMFRSFHSNVDIFKQKMSLLCYAWRPLVSRWLLSLNIKAPRHHTKHDLIMIRLHKRSFWGRWVQTQKGKFVHLSVSISCLLGIMQAQQISFSKFKRDCGKAGRNSVHITTIRSTRCLWFPTHITTTMFNALISFIFILSLYLEITTFLRLKVTLNKIEHKKRPLFGSDLVSLFPGVRGLFCSDC